MLRRRSSSRLITMKTAECEGIEPFAPHCWTQRLRGARGQRSNPSLAATTVKAIVETGRYGTKTVVCGAPNCRAGMMTAYVPAGTSLDGREIRKAEIGGVESDGMLASGAELGINRETAGILELDAEAGAPLPGCRPDHVSKSTTSRITHRPDLWGHHGMAREVAAILGKPLIDPVRSRLLPDGPRPIRWKLKICSVCPRYSALVIRERRQSGRRRYGCNTAWTSVGLNPINNIVDITNLIMAEIAQPMHAFDADMLKGDTIYARPARARREDCRLSTTSSTS